MFKKIFIILAILLLGTELITAQLITVNPPFPSDQDQVVVTFNAALGSAGLAGYLGSVYAHTGVITNNSTSGTDWKYVKAGWNENIPSCKMTNLGNDLWELTIGPSIKDYYGVPANETILQLAFVFRSSDGTLTGKTETGGDIFYDVSTGGIEIQITLPETSPLIVQLNDNIHVEGSSNDADSTFLYNNDNLVYSSTGSSFQYDFSVSENGTNWFKAVGKSGSIIVADSFSYYTRPEITIEDVPAGIVDGINYMDDNTVILSLYAPEKNYVFAIGDFSDWQVNDDNYMKRSSDGNRYWVQLNNLEAGKEYIYQYFIDGTLRVGDSYADKVSDPWNDKYISSTTYPGLIQYPEGKTDGIATVFQTAQTPYQWQTTNFQAPASGNLVIYELLIRDFTTGRTFNDLIDTLNYLDNLGVNAIELMPVSEFEGNNSWGYNPNYYFAVDKYYGPKNTFKAFVDEAHSRGIAVIMDMVLNHAYGTNPMAMMYWDSENNRPATNNPWFNVQSPNPVFNWGNDFNHESQDTKNFVDRVNKYWLEEYNIDGFRFDFTKGFTNTPGDGSGFDQSRIDILTRMSDAIFETKADAYVILEHFAANSEEKILVNNDMMIWGNMNYNYNEATMGYNENSNFSGISYKSRGFSKPSLVGYMESHDEERLMYKNLQYGNSSGIDYDITNLNTALRRNEMAAAFFITVPGPKMIWAFGELGYDFSINTCEDGSISDGCRVAPKPVKWNYYKDFNRKQLYDVYSALNNLKETEPAFSTTNFTLSVNSSKKSIHLNHDEMDVTIIGNFDVTEGFINPNFQKTGTWYDYFSGDSLIVSNTSENIGLQAGEYHIYTTKRLQLPEFVGINDIIKQSGNIKVFPNPGSGNININIMENDGSEAGITLYDLQGKLLKQYYTRQNLSSIDTREFKKGLYILKIEFDGKNYSKKLLIN